MTNVDEMVAGLMVEIGTTLLLEGILIVLTILRIETRAETA
jgi:hypothetical protein